MECRIFFVTSSCNVRSSLSLTRSIMNVDHPKSTWTRTIHCNRRFLCYHDRVSLQLTSQVMAKLFPRRLSVVLSHISRSAPSSTCYYLHHQLRLCARWPSSLPGQVLPCSNAHALSCKSTQTFFTTGQSPNVVS